MGVKSFLSELKRRNIYKVAVAYGITGWIIIQITTSVFPALEFPQWTTQFVIILVLIGFPISLIFAWAFEITPDGIRRTREVPLDESITYHTGQKLNNWIIGLLATALVLVLTERIWFAGSYPTSDETGLIEETASVAVLPFDDFSPEGDQQWFCDGLTEELLNSLARLPELKVTARTSSFQFRNTNISIREIADSLSVDHIVEGSVRRIGNQMKITAQLIRADDQGHLWSNTYERTVDDIFNVQEDIATQIASALDIYLDEAKRELMFILGTRNVEAYEAYLRGSKLSSEAYLEDNYSKLWKANRWFEKAITLDPAFAEAYYQHHRAYADYLLDNFENSPDSIDFSKAYEQMHTDLENAIQYSNDPGQQLLYRFDKVYLSNNWRPLPNLVKQISESKESVQFFVLRGDVWGEDVRGWGERVIGTLGYARLVYELYASRVEQDPFNVNFRVHTAGSLAKLGQKNAQKALAIYKNVFQDFDYFRIWTLILAGNLRQAKIEMSQLSDDSWTTIPELSFRILLGEYTLTDQGLESFTDTMETGNVRKLISLYFATGNQKKANQLAGQIDKSFLGPQKLQILLYKYGEVIPFDLNATPNLAARFKEANIEIEPFNFVGREAYRVVQKEL